MTGAAIERRSLVDIATLERLARLPVEPLKELLGNEASFHFEEQRVRDRARLDGISAAELALAENPSISSAFHSIYSLGASSIISFSIAHLRDSREVIVVRCAVLAARLDTRMPTLADIAPQVVVKAYEKRPKEEQDIDLARWIEQTGHGETAYFAETMRPALAMYDARASAFASRAVDEEFCDALDVGADQNLVASGIVRRAHTTMRFRCALDVAARWPAGRHIRRKLADFVCAPTLVPEHLLGRTILIDLVAQLARDSDVDRALRCARRASEAFDPEDQGAVERRRICSEIALSLEDLSPDDAQAWFSTAWDLRSADDVHGDPRMLASAIAAIARETSASSTIEPAVALRSADVVEASVVRSEVDKCD